MYVSLYLLLYRKLWIIKEGGLIRGYNSREWHAVYGLEIIDDISAILTDARLKMQ